ncbi:MAG: ERF family protein [Deltaproteobacteria bacterium]|nr:ERF family protein [Deltaproteobacteria bacterium]
MENEQSESVDFTALNIYQKLAEVRKSVKYLPQENENKKLNFNYVSSSQTLGAIKNKVDEVGLLLLPVVDSFEVRDHTTKNGGHEYFTILKMSFTWVNVDKPEERIGFPWTGQGLDTGEKGVGKALTYAEKYFILKFFQIPTDKDDPDAFQEKIDRNKGSEAELEAAVNKAIAFLNEKGLYQKAVEYIGKKSGGWKQEDLERIKDFAAKTAMIQDVTELIAVKLSPQLEPLTAEKVAAKLKKGSLEDLTLDELDRLIRWLPDLPDKSSSQNDAAGGGTGGQAFQPWTPASFLQKILDDNGLKVEQVREYFGRQGLETQTEIAPEIEKIFNDSNAIPAWLEVLKGIHV